MSPAVAPQAPGAMGVSAQPSELLRYLEDLGNWLGTRKAELDQIDTHAQGVPGGQSALADIRLGMSMWQAISNRYNQLMVTWDSGRVGNVELDKLSSLIWGRLDAGPLGTSTGDLQGMSLPEATRISDALVAQLRQRLRLDPSGAEMAGRLRDLRAQLDRLRSQVALEPSTTIALAQSKLDAIERRLGVIVETAERGGDIGGLVGPLEVEAATFERDLIVGGVARREQALTPDKAHVERQALLEKAAFVRDVVAAARSRVFPAPKYAVPDVAALGEIPTSQRGLTEYTERLTQVRTALEHVEQANREALEGLAELNDVRAKLRSSAHDPRSVALLKVADELLGLTPVPVAAARAAVKAVEEYDRYQLVFPQSAGGDR